MDELTCKIFGTIIGYELINDSIIAKIIREDEKLVREKCTYLQQKGFFQVIGHLTDDTTDYRITADGLYEKTKCEETNKS